MRKTSNGWSASCPCPGHGKGKGDNRPSLSIKEDADGTVTHCQVGCTHAEVMAAIGMDYEKTPELKPPGNPQWLYHNANGTAVGAVYRSDGPEGKRYSQASLQGGEWTKRAMLKPRPLYQLPRLLREEGMVVVVEGEKSADALRSLGILATTSSGGANGHAGTDWSVLSSRDVAIVPDNDEPGMKYARAVKSRLHRAWIVELPEGKPEGWDLADAAGEGWTREQVLELVRKPQAALSGERIVVDTFNPANASDQSIAALVRRDVYVMDGQLVRPGSDGTMQPLNKASLLDELARCVDYGDDDGPVRRAPDDVYESILSRPSWPGVREIKGMSGIPILREDGSVHDAIGYDAQTQHYFHGKPFAVGHTRCDAMDALQRLREVTSKTLFMAEEDQTSWIAHVITHAVRPLIKGNVPAWVYSANYPGSGKTALAQAAAWISLGVKTPVQSAKIGSSTWKNTLFSYAHKPAILLDNITVTISDPQLEESITGGSLTDRRLYTQTDATKGWKPIVALTCNTGEVGPDMARRVMPVRLEKKVITHQYSGELLDGVDRYQLAAAALTIVRAYLMNGEVERVESWTSFDHWTTMVAAPLVWLGAGDLVAWRREGIVEMAEADRGAAEIHYAIRKWIGEASFAPSDLCEMADSAELRTVKTLIKARTGSKEELNPTSVGVVLNKLGLSEYGSLKRTRSSKGSFWRLVQPDSGTLVAPSE